MILHGPCSVCRSAPCVRGRPRSRSPASPLRVRGDDPSHPRASMGRPESRSVYAEMFRRPPPCARPSTCPLRVCGDAPNSCRRKRAVILSAPRTRRCSRRPRRRGHGGEVRPAYAEMFQGRPTCGPRSPGPLCIGGDVPTSRAVWNAILSSPPRPRRCSVDGWRHRGHPPVRSAFAEMLRSTTPSSRAPRRTLRVDGDVPVVAMPEVHVLTSAPRTRRCSADVPGLLRLRLVRSAYAEILRTPSSSPWTTPDPLRERGGSPDPAAS